MGLLQEEVVLLLRRQSKGFVRTATKFRGVTKDRVSHCVCCALQSPCRSDTATPCSQGLSWTTCHLLWISESL